MDAIKPLKDEVTNILIYKKDIPRIALLKAQLNDPNISNRQDVIRYLLNSYYDHQNSTSHNQALK
jgi:hypothetical protein